MFTVKATYRGETRKFSFSESNSFPSFVQLYNQLYRIFPHLGCNYYLSKLLFSPDSSEARILIGKEVHTAEEYHRYLANPSISGPWPNPLLKFDVFDGNPYKPALNSISQPSWGIPWRTPPAMSPVGNIALPSPCPINFNPRPLSYPMPPPPILFPSPPMSASSRPMPPVWHDTSAASSPLAPRQHYGPLYSQFYSKPQQKPFASQTQTPTPQGNTCCAITEARQDVHKALHEFKQDLERILENLDVRGGATNTPVKHNSCSKCGESFFRGQQFSCVNCPTVLCYSCKHFSLPTTCRDGLLHVFADLRTPNTWPPAPQFTPFVPEMQTPITPFIPPFSPSVQAPSIPRMDGWPAAVPYSPHISPKVTHHGVVCDDCDMTIEGIRHKCLDCSNYDLCSDCISSGGAERHNAFHEFIELKEPGRVIVHVVGDRNVPPANETPQSPVVTSPIETVPAIHNATCDLCDSRIRGDRYKCVCCPDFDTCGACFTITPEQHPHHAFVRISSPADLINRQNAPISHQSHHATCNVCVRTIHGVRYKCMHPSCPDFDLCDRCEAHPIATHPDNHPLLKMKKPETVIPTVYRVGMTTLIDSEDRGRSLTRLSTPLSYKSASRSRSPSPEPLHWFRTWQPAEQQRVPGQFPFGLRTPSPPRATSPPPPLPPKGGMYWNYTPVPTSPPTIPERPPQFLYDPQYVAPTPYRYQPETPAGYNPSYVNLNKVEEGQVESSLHAPSSIAKHDELVERAIVEYPHVSYNISGPSFQRRLSVGGDSHSEELFLPDAPNFLPFQSRPTMSPIGSDAVPPALSRPVSPAVRYPDLLSLLQPPKGSPVTQDETFLTPIGDHTPLPVPEPSSAERPLSRLQSFLSDSPPHGKKASLPSPFEFFGRSIQRGSEVSSSRSHSLLDLLNEIPPRSRFSVSDVSRDTQSTIFAQVTDSPRNEDKLHPEITRLNQSFDVPFSADFIEDITVTDGQIFPPGAEFVKSWKMKNSGRDWDETTELVFVAGESFSGQVPLAPVLVGSLKSGEEIDLYTGELKAPDAPGRYVGYWRLKNSSCHLFGASIWIDITVAEHNSGRESAALSAMSSSSVIVMPSGALDITKQLDTMSMSTTVAVTAASESDVISLDGSDNSFSGVSAPSSDDDWEDGRVSVPVAGAQTVPEYVVLYDDSSSEGEA